MAPSSSIPVVWSIAGSDPTAGAGIQMDLKVMHALGTYPCTVLAGLTVQNTRGVEEVAPVSSVFLHHQMQALQQDLSPIAIKIGMLASAENAQLVADFLEEIEVPIICDPIHTASSGASFLNMEARKVLIHSLLPKTTLLTPNLPELEWILGGKTDGPEQGAEELLKMGAKAVLIKGGHAEGNMCRDYWTDGKQACWICSPRIGVDSIHGTGCFLSSSVTAFLAQGKTCLEAVVWAKAFLNQCLNTNLHLGKGANLIKISSFQGKKSYFPDIRFA